MMDRLLRTKRRRSGPQTRPVELGALNESATAMIRTVVIIVLVSAAVATAANWAWSRAWQDVNGGWSIRVGSVILANDGCGSRLVLHVGAPPHPRSRSWRSAQVGGFGYSIGQGHRRYWVPFWFPVVIFAAYPCFLLVRRRLRERTALERQLRGLCVECGYDLTGLPEPRCPECSAAVPATTVTARTMTILRTRDAILLFVCLGIGYRLLSLLAFLTMALIFSPYFGPADLASEFSGHFLVVGGYGAVLGLCWCSFGVPLLHRKSMRDVVGPLALVAGVVACVKESLAAIAPIIGGWTALLVTTTALVIACLVLRRVLPDAPRGAGFLGDANSKSKH